MVKTLTIRNEIYDKLIKIKAKDESFSELFDRLTENEKNNISEFAGFLSKSKAKKIKTIFEKNRKNNTLDLNKEKRLHKQW